MDFALGVDMLTNFLLLILIGIALVHFLHARNVAATRSTNENARLDLLRDIAKQRTIAPVRRYSTTIPKVTFVDPPAPVAVETSVPVERRPIPDDAAARVRPARSRQRSQR